MKGKQKKQIKKDPSLFEISESARDLNQGDFSIFYEFYLTPIYRYLFIRSGSKELSEDLAQSVFLKAWENKEAIKSKSNSLAWLYVIARNTLIDHWKKKKDITTDKVEDYEEVSNDNSLEEDLDHRIYIKRIISKLDNLSDDQKEVIMLKFFEDLSNKEIEKITGKSSTAVRSLQYRGLMEIKKHLKKEI